MKQSISEFVVFVSRLYDAVLSSLSSVRARRRRSESGICGAHPRSFLALDDGFDVDPILPIARMILDESLSRSEKEKREESSFWRRKGFRFVESSESRANSTAMSDTEFRVSALLVGHSEDVKSITATSLNLYSTSYDSSIRSWTSTPAATTQESTETASASSQRWREVTKLEPHNEGFINASHAFSFTPTGSATPQEYLATGGKSALVQIYSLPLESNVNATPAFSLIGHRTNVCAIHSTPTPTSSTVNSGKRRQKLVSSSWDGTARIWDVEKDFECTAVLEGHTGAVWDVLFVKQTSKDEDTLLTASADKLIILWNEGKQALLFKGHTAAVRALAKVCPEDEKGTLFASCSNDATVRIWSLSGDAITVLEGQNSFIYSLAVLPSTMVVNGGNAEYSGGHLITAGEDGIVKIWDEEDGECLQTIIVPASSVWTIAALDNGDIAVGSDRRIWIFTQDADRFAEESLEKEFAALVATRPKPVPVAEVEAAPGARTMFEDVEYDFVFSIDIADDRPAIKLPYNVGDDSQDVAVAFVTKHALPVSYTDTIAEFIRTNSRS